MTEGKFTWNSFNLDGIHRAGERDRGGVLRPIASPLTVMNFFSLCYRENKVVEKMQTVIEKKIKNKIDAIGKNHREKAPF